MERFRFPLARVLEWRRQQQRLEEEALAALLAEHAALNRARENADREALALQAEPRADGSHLIEDLAAVEDYRQVLRRKSAQFLSRSEDCAARIANQRLRIQEARRRVRLLERLEETQRRQWQAEFDRRQETLAADLYLARWRRTVSRGP